MDPGSAGGNLHASSMSNYSVGPLLVLIRILLLDTGSKFVTSTTCIENAAIGRTPTGSFGARAGALGK